MIFHLIWRGHKISTIAQAAITVALAALISGILSVAIGSTDKSNELKRSPAVSTELVQKVNTLDGIGTYSFLVAMIAVLASFLIIASVVQFTVTSARSTIQSLRVYGVPQVRVRLAFLSISVVASAVAFACSFVLAPVVELAFRMVLSMTGLEVSDVPISLSSSVLFWTAFGFAIFSGSVAFRVSKPVASLGVSPGTRKKWVDTARILLRVVTLVAMVCGLIAILRTDATMDNVNEITFGAMFTALIATWCLLPVIVSMGGRVIKILGARGLAAGGAVSSESRRISSIALISALLLGLGGTSAILTLASSSAGQYLAMSSISADAVTSENVTSGSADVAVSPFDFDNGWLMDDKSAEQAPLIIFDSSTFDAMLDQSTVVDGSLSDVEGNNVIAGSDRYHLGDTISVVSDSGERRDLKVVALSDPESILGGSIGADVVTYSASDPANVEYRSYASSADGIEKISSELPGYHWQTIREFVDDDLESAQSSQMASVLSMIGGVAVVALFGLIYSAVGFSIDQRRVDFSLDRMGMGRLSRRAVFIVVGCTIAISSAVLSVCALLAAFSRVSDVLDSLGVTYPLDVPWMMLIGMWAVTAVAAVVGMVAGQHRRIGRRGEDV